ncbi:hypothetical protein SEA_AIKOCARSON_67 [Gordonia phage AikoCarson]|nr:hypothetical protein SEA_AIKOCARSON_67 [Gordonia phage AikoCarson]
MANQEARPTAPAIEPDATAEDLRKYMAFLGVKPAEDEHCNVNYVAMQAISAMQRAFLDLSAHIETMYGDNGGKLKGGKKR